VHRTSTNTFAAVVGTEREWVRSSCDAKVFPVEFVRTVFIAHPIAFCVPEWPSFNSDDFESSSREPLQEHASSRSDPHNAVINLLVLRESLHWHFDVLHGAKSVFAPWGSFEFSE
jgi:hypothetical protein